MLYSCLEVSNHLTWILLMILSLISSFDMFEPSHFLWSIEGNLFLISLIYQVTILLSFKVLRQLYCIYYPLMLPNSKPLNSKELLVTSTSSFFQSLFCQLKLIVNNAMPHWLSFWICLLAGLYHRKNIRNEGKAQENCTRDGIPKFPRLIFIPHVYQIKFLCSPTPDLWLSQVHMYIPYAYQIKTV
jgi:hypothetical protein